MAHHEVTLIPGDDSGPELVAAATDVLAAAVGAVGSTVAWEVRYAGATALDRLGTPLPEETVDSIRRTGTALKGPLTTPIGSGFRSVNVALRQRLGLYACLRPCHLLPGVRSKFRAVDLVVIRENTEGLYAGLEFANGEPRTQDLIALLGRCGRPADADAGVTLKVISWSGSTRIARFAFDYARRAGRSRVTCVTRADLLPATDGLFAAAFREVAAGFPDIGSEQRRLDEVCAQMVRSPAEFDILVLPNLYGDVLSELAAGLVGGLGVAPSANLGHRLAIFEATHGSAPQFRGTGRLNPTALILSGALLLEHLHEPVAAQLVRSAVAEVIGEGRVVTFDLASGPPDAAAGTAQFAAEVIRVLGNHRRLGMVSS